MGRLKNKRGRKSNYRKDLESNETWPIARRKVLVRDSHSCRCCSSRIRLEVHHIAYYIDGKTIMKNELNFLTWLITVCEDCHDKIHANPNHVLNPKNKNKINEQNYRNYRENR